MAEPENATATAAAPARGRWRRRAGWTIGAIVLLLLAVFFALPPIVKSQAEKALANATGRTAAIERLEFNPFDLTAIVEGFTLADREGATPLLTIRALTANMSIASLWQWAPIFDSLQVVEPRFYFVRDAAGKYNVQDLIDASRAKPEGPPPKFSLNNIEIIDGAIAFDDRPAERKHEVAKLAMRIPFLSSLPVDVAVRVTPHLSAVVNGTAFSLDGTTVPFAARREATLDIDIDAFVLRPYLAYLPVKLAPKLTSGSMTTKLKVAFVDGDEKTRSLTMTGEAMLDGVALTHADNAPLVAAQKLAVKIGKLDVFGRKLDIEQIEVTSPVVDVRRAKDGTIDIARPLVADAPAPAAPAEASAPATPAEPAPPWEVRVAAAHVGDGTLRVADDAVKPAFRTTLSEIDIKAAKIALPAAEEASVALGFKTDLGAVVALQATVVPATGAAQGQVEMKHLALARLYPYYGDLFNLDVTSGTIDFAGRFAYAPDAKAPRFTVSEGSGAIDKLELGLPGEKKPLWRMPQLALAGVAIDSAARRLEFGELTARDAFADVRREADGTINFARFMTTTAATGRGDEETWTLLIRKVALAGFGADIEDRTVTPPVMLRLREFGGSGENITNARGQRGSVNLRTRVGERGRIAFNGPVTTNPFAIDGRVDAEGLLLATIQPYLDQLVNVTVTNGTAATKGRLVFGLPDGAPLDAPRRVTYAGDVTVSDFASLDKPTASDLAKWKTLTLSKVDIATAPFALAIGNIALDDFYARVIVYEDATLNLTRLLTPGSTPAPQAPPAAPAASAATRTATTAAPAGSSLPLRIGNISTTRGNVEFSDFFIKPNYSANLTEVAGTVSTMSPEQAGEIDLSAKIDRTAPVKVKGKLNPFAKDLTLDLTGEARGIELSPLSMYSGKYAGYGIEKGKLSGTVAYKIENRKLHATNRIVLDQLTFGAKVDSPSATKLPVLLAVALLKDRNGVIDIELPIEGSLDDPQFSVGGLIVRVIVNLITKAVTAPFALLGAIAGHGGAELSYIDYAPGSAALAPDGEKKLESLAKALTERPALKLEITGRADPAADRAALETAALDTLLKARKLMAIAASDNAPATAAEMTFAEGERDKYLTATYRDFPIPERPKNAAGELEPVPPAQMEAMLRKTMAVSDDALRALAYTRSGLAKEKLVGLGVPDERLYSVAPKLAGEGEKKVAAGVEFSLR